MTSRSSSREISPGFEQLLGADEARGKVACGISSPSALDQLDLHPDLFSSPFELNKATTTPITCSGAPSARVLLVRAHSLVAYCNSYMALMRGRGAKSGCKIQKIQNSYSEAGPFDPGCFVTRLLQIKLEEESRPVDIEHPGPLHRVPVGYQCRQYATTGLHLRRWPR